MKTPIAAPTRLSRLIQLNARTSELMEFMDRETFKQRFGMYPEEAEPDEEQVRSQRKVIGATAAGAGLVGAGFIGQRAINKAGGYGAVATKTAQAATDAGKRTASYASKIGTELKYARNLGGTLRSGPLNIAKDFLKRAKGVRFESRQKALVRLGAVLDKAIEFDTPIGQFNRTRAESLKGIKKAQDKVHRESYVRRGAAIGGIGGLAAGTVVGALATRRHPEGVAKLLATAGGAYLGGLGGLVGGVQVGGRIRRKHPLPE